jgi:threonine dehydrogenase-like Zn-dependent dehydrogenase
MKTHAVRLYGKDDLRLESFDLPDIREDEILARVISDSLCMSSYKATKLGADHKRIPDDVAQQPVIIGHEFSGEIIEVGSKWKNRFKAGSKFSIQPALNYKGSLDAPGYSFQFIGGDATYIIIPHQVMELNCLLPYAGEGFFPAALSEPYSCVAGTFHAHYHTRPGSYVHEMGIVEGGKMAILAGVGPMGLAAIDYIIHCDRRPSLLVVTDIDQERLDRAASLLTVADAEKHGVQLQYKNTANLPDTVSYLRECTGGTGFDDVLVFAPVKKLVEEADAILGRDGCLNFFAGPSDTEFTAEINFYNAHYISTHIVGTSGGNTDDMIESLNMMSNKQLRPEILVTHIGGLDAVIDATKDLPNIPGGKKLIYTNIRLELTAIDEFVKKASDNPLFARLAEICDQHGGLWSIEAEKYLLENAAYL